MATVDDDDLRSLVDHLPDIVWTLDVSGERPRYSYISPAVERVLGEPKQVFLDDVEHFFRRVHRNDLEFLQLAPPGPESDQSGRTRARYFKPDGTMIWLDVHWTWVYGPAGVSLIHGMTRDVTEAAEIEARLRRSELGMRNAQAVSNVGTFEWDAARGWSIWSPEHYRLFGYEPPDEIRDAQEIFQTVVLPEDFVKVARAWQRAMEGHELFSVDYRIQRPDGEVRWIESRGGPRYDEQGRFAGVDGTVRDVTAEKRADEALRRFVADAAHELRTPVAAIAGAVDLLVRRRETLDPEQIEVVLDVLARQTQRLQDIHSSLFDLMAFEYEVGRIELSSVDLNEIVTAALQEVPVREGATVELTGARLEVTADAPRLVKIISELLRNAYEHGGDHVEVHCELIDGTAEIAVADDGPGLSGEQVAHVFLPFSRGEKSRGRGAGVGLAVVERLAAVIGATVSYEPLGRGSRFVVRIPGALADDREHAGSTP